MARPIRESNDMDAQDAFDAPRGDATEAPRFQITRHRTDERPGKYDAEVRALIEADKELTEEDIAEGIFNSLTILIPAPAEKEKDGETVAVDQAPKFKRYVQESAKAHGKTAREVNSVENGDGTVSFEFRLTDQVKRPRKAKTEGIPDDADTSPADVAA